MDIQKSIRLALAHKNMKATDLARQMGVSDAYISAIMTGKKNPNLQSLASMAMITGFKPSEFIALGEAVPA